MNGTPHAKGVSMITIVSTRNAASEQNGSLTINPNSLLEAGAVGINQFDHLYVGEHNFKLEVAWAIVQTPFSSINNPNP